MKAIDKTHNYPSPEFRLLYLYSVLKIICGYCIAANVILTCVTPFLSIRNRLIDQCPLDKACSKPFVMMSCLITLQVETGFSIASHHGPEYQASY